MRDFAGAFDLDCRMESVEKLLRINILYDCYGSLLTPKQQQILNFHYHEDLGLSEIAVQLNISRQAVHDAVRHAEAKLRHYESKLGLAQRFWKQREALRTAHAKIAAIEAQLSGGGAIYDTSQLLERLGALKECLSELADVSLERESHV